MIDFDELEQHNSRAVARVFHTDSLGKQRGPCNKCDCLEWVCRGDLNSDLPRQWRPRPYNLVRHDMAGESTTADDTCRRCGCHAHWHEDISEFTSHLWTTGSLGEAEEGWTDVERMLFYQTGGLFYPGGAADRRADEGPPQAAGTRGGLSASVICPTESDRREFHPSLYACFCEQTLEPRELVVVDTGQGGLPSEFFTKGPPASDPRVIYRYFNVLHLPWSIGVKRNVACYLARGALIVHFDDDDLYAPTYLAWMVHSVQEGSAGAHEGVGLRSMTEESYDIGTAPAGHVGSVRQSGFAADAATFSAWITFSIANGSFGLCDVDHDFGGRRDWTLGYGFSFAYLRRAWQVHWFRDANLGEDHKFFEALLARGARIALLRDQGAGLCAHTRHKSNFSPWERDSPVDLAAIGPALPGLGRRLRRAVGNMDRALHSLGANGKVRLTPRTADEMQNDLLVAFMSEEFQRRLHATFEAAGEDPRRRREACRLLCLEVQGPIIAKFGFEPSWCGVLASTAAFKLVMSEEWENPDTLQFHKGELINWLMQPERQHFLPMEREDLIVYVSELLKLSMARYRRE